VPRRSRGFTRGTAPPTAPYLIVQLKPAWRADLTADAFVHGRRKIRLHDLIGAGVSLAPHIPAVAEKAPRSLSAQERELARFVQVRTTLPSQLRDAAKRLKQCDAVDAVILPPEVSLPG
jgi:hypothetical protein